MSNSIRDYQIRVNSLRILKEPLVVDNKDGPKTRYGILQAKDYFNVRRQEDIFHSSGINRIHWHWTASTYEVNDNVTKHYNNCFDIKGICYNGGSLPKDQASYDYKRGVGVSHTLNANTGAIGLAVVACADRKVTNWAKGIVNIGKYPMNWKQIDSMLKKTAEYCLEYDIRPSPWTVLTHAEVQGNIGIKQRGKWDIRVLPDEPTVLLDALEAGNILRKRMKRFF